MFVHALRRDFFPSARGVAGLATLGKCSAVRIFVAVGTLIEWNAHVLWFCIWAVGMALGALYLGMQPGQRISRFRVIELVNVDLLPVHEIVTGLTRWPEPSFVLILVAGGAGGRETKVGLC